MISYSEFLQVVKEQLPGLLPEEYKDASIDVFHVDKHLSGSYDGINVLPQDQGCGVGLDLSYIYENLDKIEEVPAAVSMAAEDVVRALQIRPKGLELVGEDLEFLSRHVIPQLIPVKGNEGVLEQVPHRYLDDMAIVYRVMFPHEDGDMLTSIVDDHLLNNYEDLDADTFHDMVMLHAPEEFPVRIDEVDASKHLLFEAYCEGAKHGTACILYPDFIKQAADVIGDNFFVLPFSMYLALLIRDNGEISMEFVRDTAFRLSTDPFMTDERLTKEVYYCDIEEGTMTKAGGYRQ